MNSDSRIATEELQTLLADFHRLTGMKICLYDSNGREVFSHPDRLTVFCAALRRDPVCNERCEICDREAIARCRRTGKTQIYCCHAGLTECMTPIVIHDGIRGFIAIGQFRSEPVPGEQTAIPGGALPEGEAERLYRALPVLPQEQITAAVHILEACAGYDQLKRAFERAEHTLSERMERYVAEHRTGNLSADCLCRELGLSRRELYETVRKHFGCTPAEFVRLRRLEYAADLLRNSDLPVRDIAEACGIGDYNYFSKIFRHRFGVCPRGFRRLSPARSAKPQST